MGIYVHRDEGVPEGPRGRNTERAGTQVPGPWKVSRAIGFFSRYRKKPSHPVVGRVTRSGRDRRRNWCEGDTSVLISASLQESFTRK
ncbi:MAG: hypothetical protein MUC66_08700 [Methanolinea sp.]|nr:hypothetical protein [Methanolinea sp.]